MNITYNNIVDIIRNFQNEHLQIESFGYGDTNSIGKTKDVKYPMLFVNPTNSVLGGGATSRLSFNILLMDRLQESLNNEQEVHSDMIAIASDLRSYMQRSASDYFTVTDTSNIYPFTERFGDNVGGWNFECTIEAEWDFSICQIPGVSDQQFTDQGNIIVTNYRDLLANYMPLSGGTFTGNVYVPTLTATTYYSGSTPLTTIIQNIAAGSSSSSTSFSAGTNLQLVTGSTYPNVTYSLNMDLDSVLATKANISGNTTFSAATISANRFILSGSNLIGFFALQTDLENLSASTISSLATKANISGNTTFSATSANTTYLKVNTLSAGTQPERIIAYDESSSYSNVFVGYASASTYAQLNIRNLNGGNQSSSDIVATANNGSESVNYIDMGINSSTFTGYFGSANDAYIYSTGNDLLFGNITSNKAIKFLTDGTGSTNVRLSITSASTIINNLSATTLSAETYYSGSTPLSSVVLLSAQTDISSYRKKGSTLLERWYSSSVNSASLTTAVVARNVNRYIPLVVPKRMTIDLMAINVTAFGAASSVARIGIYDSEKNESANSNMLPKNVVLDAGTVAVDSNGVKTITGLNTTLEPGLYYLTLNHNSSSNVTFRSSAVSSIPPVLGMDSTMTTTSTQYLTENYTFNTYSAATANAMSAVATSAPTIAFRLSA